MNQLAQSTRRQERRAGPEVHLDDWVTPEICDEHGYIRAGKILEWMDVVGVLAATRHCHRPVVTASVDGMELRDPIRVGERVTMTAVVGYTSDRSMGVSVSMRHGPPDAGAARKSLAGYMTFVTLDTPIAGPGSAQQRISPLECATDEERSIFKEIEHRLALQRALTKPVGEGK